MSNPLQSELEILWTESDVEVVLEAHERLKSIATEADLPALVTALRSERNNFWTRELLSEPIVELGGVQHLSDLFVALEKNFSEGHDNDSLEHFLTEIAIVNRKTCKTELERLLSSPEFKYREYAEWLLEFCASEDHDSEPNQTDDNSRRSR